MLVISGPLAELERPARGCSRLLEFAEDLLPVRYDPQPGSLYDRLTRGLRLPVRLWLVQTNGASLFTGKGNVPGSKRPSTGSAKCDAYIWAIERWIKTGKAAPGMDPCVKIR
jgi:hypothetical protein